MRISNRLGGAWSAATLTFMLVGTLGQALAQSQVPQTLIYAVYGREDAAKNAFDAMKQSQREGVIHIDSFAVITKNQKGHVHVQSTQKRGAAAGAVVGAMIGVLGGPAGAAAGAGAGGALGYLTGNAVGIPREDINAIKSSLTPGTSAVVAVVDERWVADVERSLQEAQAKQVMEHKIAGTAEPAPEKGANPPPPSP
jgi:uncharacterized membrane protein